MRGSKGVILDYCASCYRVTTCRKICKKVKKLLRSEDIHAANFIRPQMNNGMPREIPFSSLGVDPDKDPYLTDSGANGSEEA